MFYDGIRHNSTITNLFLSAISYGDISITNVVLEVLGACQEKNILTKLLIKEMPLISSAEENRLICRKSEGFQKSKRACIHALKHNR